MIPGHMDLMSKRGNGGKLMPWKHEITMGWIMTQKKLDQRDGSTKKMNFQHEIIFKFTDSQARKKN